MLMREREKRVADVQHEATGNVEKANGNTAMLIYVASLPDTSTYLQSGPMSWPWQNGLFEPHMIKQVHSLRATPVFERKYVDLKLPHVCSYKRHLAMSRSSHVAAKIWLEHDCVFTPLALHYTQTPPKTQNLKRFLDFDRNG